MHRKRCTCKIQAVFLQILSGKHELVIFVVIITSEKLISTIHYSTTKRVFMHYGKTLMLLRKFKDTTQQELANKLATTQQYISELEKQNHFNGTKLDSILKALDSNKEEWEQLKKFSPASTN